VHGLGLNSRTQWNAYCRSGKKPADIPAYPRQTYLNEGWAGYGDWLGTGTVAPRLREYRSFKEARAFVRSLGLKSLTEWREYSKSGKKPADIPAYPSQTYANSGWAGMGDWLGTGTVAPQLHQYRTFKDARAFARDLGLKSNADWKGYCKSGKKPNDIPAKPSRTYANDGWAGMRDWLGYARNTHPSERSQMMPRVAEGPTAPAATSRE
jgi:Phage-integrase repeat unit